MSKGEERATQYLLEKPTPYPDLNRESKNMTKAEYRSRKQSAVIPGNRIIVIESYSIYCLNILIMLRLCSERRKKSLELMSKYEKPN
jgi:hypothetical protein